MVGMNNLLSQQRYLLNESFCHTSISIFLCILTVAYRNFNCQYFSNFYNEWTIAPNTTLISTTLYGANLYTTKSVKVINTITKSIGLFTALVNTGS